MEGVSIARSASLHLAAASPRRDRARRGLFISLSLGGEVVLLRFAWIGDRVESDYCLFTNSRQPYF